MTYFFCEGKLHCILNKLHKNTTDDYDSKGTATMIIKVLCETLGLTKEKLSQMLVHFIYDGVYAGMINQIISLLSMRTRPSKKINNLISDSFQYCDKRFTQMQYLVR